MVLETNTKIPKGNLKKKKESKETWIKRKNDKIVLKDNSASVVKPCRLQMSFSKILAKNQKWYIKSNVKKRVKTNWNNNLIDKNKPTEKIYNC